MAEPTLRDVVKMLETMRAELGAKVDAVRNELGAKVDAVRNELGARIESVRAELADDVADVRAEVSAHRTETAKGFADLDRELARHADPTHRHLEADIATLHRALLRVPTARVPKELPSQVRAKAGVKPKAPAQAKKRAVK